MPFETILDKFAQSDFWILNYNGNFNRRVLLSEYQGYAKLKPYQTKEIYGCKVDSNPTLRRSVGVPIGCSQT